MLAFFLIVGVSFLIMAGTLTNMLGGFLFEQRIRAQRAGLEKWAVRVAPLLAAVDMETLDVTLVSAGAELSGRLLVLDIDGKVQADSFHEAWGTRLEYPEVASILTGGLMADYGVHTLAGEGPVSPHLRVDTGSSEDWVSYCTAGVVHDSDVIGVLLLASSVHEMMRSLVDLQEKMVMLFVAVAAVAVLMGMVFAGVITRPIVELTGVIRRMSGGDYAARVPERGSGEIRHLASAFNHMSEQLQMLEQSRNQFVSDASHELKTPLATMKIMIESLIYQPEMEEPLRTEFLSDVNAEIDRLSSVISDLLTLVQADAHSMGLTRERMSLAAVIKETAHRLDPIVQQRGQKLSLVFQDSCDMYADRPKLLQVAYNLMENAVKYTQQGGSVTVTLSRSGHDATMVVADNGPGIPKESIGHLFERFYRVDRARSRERGGTGLGLSIVHQIVALHGGSVGVESEEGKGSTFRVRLPIHRG